MSKFIKIEGDFRIYELDANECRQHGRAYPTFACWDKDDHEDIGNMNRTKCETEKIEDMIEWCQEYSYRDPDQLTEAEILKSFIRYGMTKKIREVRKGEWIIYKVEPGLTFIICSLCHSTLDCDYQHIGKNEFNYCPYCGAEMKGGEE